MKFKLETHLFFSLCLSVLTAGPAFALPFNSEMVGGQLITGSVMRPKAKDSVAVGTVNRHRESREELLSLNDPLKGDPVAVREGRRLFAITCSPCHGHFENAKQVPSDLLQKGMPSMDLTDPAIAAKPDGHFFGYIYLGGIALMPAHGWKFSDNEIWQIVSYVRDVQAQAKEAQVKQ